jgi:hypothetical protein
MTVQENPWLKTVSFAPACRAGGDFQLDIMLETGYH